MKTKQNIFIIVTFNEAEKISCCIDSIDSSQSDILVIDNSSNDSTPEILRSINNIHYLLLTKNVGFGRANNIGVTWAINQNYKTITLLNADATIDHSIEQEIFQRAIDEETIISGIQLQGSSDQYDLNFYSQLKQQGINPDALPDKFEMNFTNASFWIIPISLLQKIGSFNPIFFLYAEDNELCDRLNKFNKKIVIYKKLIYRHHREKRDESRFNIEATFSKYIYAILRRPYRIDLVFRYFISVLFVTLFYNGRRKNPIVNIFKVIANVYGAYMIVFFARNNWKEKAAIDLNFLYEEKVKL